MAALAPSAVNDDTCRVMQIVSQEILRLIDANGMVQLGNIAGGPPSEDIAVFADIVPVTAHNRHLSGDIRAEIEAGLQEIIEAVVGDLAVDVRLIV